jgi:hypothetical protein
MDCFVASLLAMTGETVDIQTKSPGDGRGFYRVGQDHLAAPSLSRRLGLAPPRGEDVFGIAVGLSAALEDEVAGGLEGDTVE